MRGKSQKAFKFADQRTPAAAVPTTDGRGPGPVWRSLDLDDHLNLHSRVARKRRHAYGGARVLAFCLAKDVRHQIRKSIYHAWLVTKTLR